MPFVKSRLNQTSKANEIILANIHSNIDEDGEIKCNKWWFGAMDIKNYAVMYSIAAFEFKKSWTFVLIYTCVRKHDKRLSDAFNAPYQTNAPRKSWKFN